ncbi:hypothetical protein J4Q44_G00368960, partial [Coregonus suidteri]
LRQREETGRVFFLSQILKWAARAVHNTVKQHLPPAFFSSSFVFLLSSTNIFRVTLIAYLPVDSCISLQQEDPPSQARAPGRPVAGGVVG